MAAFKSYKKKQLLKKGEILLHNYRARFSKLTKKEYEEKLKLL